MGQEIYVVEIAPQFHGRQFATVANAIFHEHSALLFGIKLKTRPGEPPVTLIPPRPVHRLRKGDIGFVIADDVVQVDALTSPPEDMPVVDRIARKARDPYNKPSVLSVISAVCCVDVVWGGKKGTATEAAAQCSLEETSV